MVVLGGDGSRFVGGVGWVVAAAGMLCTVGGTLVGLAAAAAGALTARRCLWFRRARSCWLIFCHLKYEMKI
jgi:hypothetical protein